MFELPKKQALKICPTTLQPNTDKVSGFWMAKEKNTHWELKKWWAFRKHICLHYSVDASTHDHTVDSKNHGWYRTLYIYIFPISTCLSKNIAYKLSTVKY